MFKFKFIWTNNSHKEALYYDIYDEVLCSIIIVAETEKDARNMIHSSGYEQTWISYDFWKNAYYSECISLGSTPLKKGVYDYYYRGYDDYCYVDIESGINNSELLV